MSDNLRSIGFDVCDGKPCFSGITPGVTTVEDALAFLLDKNVAFRDSGHRIRFGINSMSCTIVKWDDTPFVTGLELSPYGWDGTEVRIPLAEFCELYGELCIVYVSPANRKSRHNVGFCVEYPLLSILCQDIKDEDNNEQITNALITLLQSTIPAISIQPSPTLPKRCFGGKLAA